MKELIAENRNEISFVLFLIAFVALIVFRRSLLGYDKEKFRDDRYYRIQVRKDRFTYWIFLIMIFIITLNFLFKSCDA